MNKIVKDIIYSIIYPAFIIQSYSIFKYFYILLFKKVETENLEFKDLKLHTKISGLFFISFFIFQIIYIGINIDYMYYLTEQIILSFFFIVGLFFVQSQIIFPFFYYPCSLISFIFVTISKKNNKKE